MAKRLGINTNPHWSRFVYDGEWPSQRYFEIKAEMAEKYDERGRLRPEYWRPISGPVELSEGSGDGK